MNLIIIGCMILLHLIFAAIYNTIDRGLDFIEFERKLSNKKNRTKKERRMQIVIMAIVFLDLITVLICILYVLTNM